MEGKVYSSRSNAKRAALKEFPEGNFRIDPKEGGFAFVGLEIQITSEGEVFVDRNEVDYTAPPELPQEYVEPAPVVVSNKEQLAALPPGSYVVTGAAFDALMETQFPEILSGRDMDGSTLNLEPSDQPTNEQREEAQAREYAEQIGDVATKEDFNQVLDTQATPIADGAAMFASMFAGLVPGNDAAKASSVLAAKHEGARNHKLADNDGGCPLCGADPSSITMVDPNQANDDHRAECHECGKRFNRMTGQEIRYGYTKENAPRGHKIQKDRPMQNGVKRPSDGTQCGDVWAECDKIGENCTSRDMRRVNDEKGWNMNNTLIEFYQWRKFNGYTGKRGAK